MNAPRTTHFVLAFAALLLGLGIASLDAAPFRPVPPPAHMPGWDWWRTYPWSPYNYGRNPYNPIIIPYPIYGPSYYPFLPYVPPPASPSVPPEPPPELTLPSVSGPLAVPPPGTALIRVQIPDPWAAVYFNGQDSVTIGTQRTFVSPRLSPDGEDYTVTASFTREGRLISQRRLIHVVPGQIQNVTFR